MYEPNSPRTMLLLDKYGGVAFDHGAMPKLVAVHTLMNDRSTSYEQLKTIWGATVHSPFIGEEPPKMTSPRMVRDGDDCRGAQGDALLSYARAVQPAREIPRHQQENGLPVQSNINVCHNINVENKTNARVSIHWNTMTNKEIPPRAACDKEIPMAQEIGVTMVPCPAYEKAHVEDLKKDSREGLRQEFSEKRDASVHTVDRYTPGSVQSDQTNKEATVHLPRNGSDVNHHHNMRDHDNSIKNSSNNKRTVACLSPCNGDETVHMKSTCKMAREEASSTAGRTEDMSLEEKRIQLLKQREDILQKIKHVLRERRKVKARTWAVPSFLEKCGSSRQIPVQEDTPSSWDSAVPAPSTVLATNHNGNTCVDSEKYEMLSPAKYCIREKAAEYGPAVVTSGNPREVKGSTVVTTCRPAVERDDGMSGGVVLPCEHKEPSRKDLSVERVESMGQESVEAAVVDAHQEQCADQVEVPPRKRSRKSVPRKIIRRATTGGCRETGAEQGSSSAEAGVAQAREDYYQEKYIIKKETRTDQSEPNTCSSREPDKWTAQGSSASVGQRTSEQTWSCTTGTRNVALSRSSNSCVFTDRKVAALNPSFLGNLSELSKLGATGMDDSAKREEFSVVGSFDRQARIRELLRKQEQLMKQVQMTSRAR